MPYIEHERKQLHLVAKLLNQNFDNKAVMQLEYKPATEEEQKESIMKLNQYLFRIAKEVH